MPISIKHFALAGLFAVAMGFFPFALSAQAQGLGGYAIEDFDASITVNPDSSLNVVEEIQTNFFESRHGIFRYIPFLYENPDGTQQSINIQIVDVQQDGQPAEYDAFYDGTFFVFKIGHPDIYVSGPVTYTIAYHVDRAILYHEDADELYWNVTGNEWDVPIEHARATVTVAGASADAMEANCYVGELGSTSQDCTTQVNDGEAVFEGVGYLTASLRFPKGLVATPPKISYMQWWFSHNWDLFFLPIPFIVIVVLYKRWRRIGRDVKGSGTIVPMYDPPDDLRPTEVGTLMDIAMETKDFSAAFVDLAVRGYLHLTDEETKTLGVFKNHVYKVRREKSDDDSLRPFEKKVLGAFGSTIGVDVDVKSRQKELMEANKEVEKLIYQDLVDRGYYLHNPSTQRGKYILAAIAVGGIGMIVGGTVANELGRPVAMIIFLVTAVCIGIAGWFMPARTAKGTTALEHAKGFKMFLEKAEKYRLQWQEREGIFEKFLPYAMVLGVADKWSDTFKGIEQQQPRWFSGNVGAFNAVTFGQQMQSFVSTTSTMAAPRSSGGGGGGGSSGGGFGGGGGGSW